MTPMAYHKRQTRQECGSTGIEIMNGAVNELKGPTWFMTAKEYTLDYACANERGLQCVK